MIFIIATHLLINWPNIYLHKFQMKHPTQYESYESMKNGHEYSLEAGPSPFTCMCNLYC